MDHPRLRVAAPTHERTLRLRLGGAPSAPVALSLLCCLCLLHGVAHGASKTLSASADGTDTLLSEHGVWGQQSVVVSDGALSGGTDYCWTVRYADNRATDSKWGEWSELTCFETIQVATQTPTWTGTLTSTPTAVTPSRTASITRTGTATATSTPTATATPTGTAFPSLTATDTPEISSCAADCNRDGAVPVDEVVTAVNIALGSSTVDACPEADVNGDGRVTVDELITAVHAALTWCPAPKPCTFSLSPDWAEAPYWGTSGCFDVATSQNCCWEAGPGAEGGFYPCYVRLTSGQTGCGDGSVCYEVKERYTDEHAWGYCSIAVGDAEFTVDQDGWPTPTR